MWQRTTCNLDFQMGGFTSLILMLPPGSGLQHRFASSPDGKTPW